MSRAFAPVEGGGGAEFFVREEAVRGDTRLIVELFGEPGDVTLRVMIEESGRGVRAELRDLLNVSARVPEVNLIVRPSTFAGLESSIQRNTGQLVGISSTFIQQSLRGALPDRTEFRFTQTIDLGETVPIETTFGPVTFTPLIVPDVEGVQDFLDSIRTPTLRIDMETPGFIESLLTDFPGVSITIPPEAFIDVRSLDTFSCAELNPNIEEQISSARSQIQEARGEVTSGLDTLESIESRLLSATGASSLGGITGSRIQRLSDTTIEDIRQDLQQVTEPDINIGSIRNNLESLQNEVDDLVPRCQSDFGSELDTLLGRLDSLDTDLDEFSNLLNEIEGVIGTVGTVNCEEAFSSINNSIEEIEDTLGTSPSPGDFSSSQLDNLSSELDSVTSTLRNETASGSTCRERFSSRIESLRGDIQNLREGVRFDCSDVSLSIRNGVNGLEQNVENFVDKPRERRRQSRKNDLIENSNQLEEEVRQNVADQNPCKNQLLSRIQAQRERLQRTEARPPEFVSCSEQFPDIERQVDTLEDQVLGIGGGLTAGELEDIIQNADSITNQIRNRIPGGNPCRGRLSGRVDSALESLERQSRSARVRITIPEEQAERARQQVEDFREELQAILERS